MLKFLVKGVFRDRHRYLFPLIMVGTGVWMMVFMLAFMNGYTQSFISQNAGFQTGHLKVVTRAYAEMPELRPYDLGLLDIQPQLELWKREFPQLEWSQRIPFGALMDVPDANGETREQGNVMGFGVELFGDGPDRRLMNLDKALVSGHIPSRAMELLISDKALHRLKLRLGDPVTLIGTDIHGGMVFRNFRISGTIDFGMESLDRGAVIADISDIRMMLDMEGGAGEILALFKDGKYDQSTVNAIRDSFNRRFSDPDDEYSPLMQAMSDQNNLGYLMAMLDNILAMVSFIFTFILGVVLWNSGLMNGIRRYSEFGVRLAVGESKPHIYRSLLLEALIIGVAGSIIGIGLGLASSLWAGTQGLDMRVFSRNSSLMAEDMIYPSMTLGTALAGFIPGVLSNLLGAALAGIAVFRRQTARLFNELEV